ncbi:male-enhanced antigen 1 isoform X2 [Lissotriton helveticus]
MEVVVPRGETMGPERIFPNSNEDLGEQRPPEGLQDNMGDWSGDDPEEEEEEQQNEEEEDNVNGGGYFYQPLNQDPESGAFGHHSHPGQEGGGDYSHLEQADEGLGPQEEAASNIHERLQEMRLHLPDPPMDSDDEDTVEASATDSPISIPMDAAHVELVKKTMAGIQLPSLGVPPWAMQISDEQWKDMVQLTLQSRENAAAPGAGWKGTA